MARHLEFEPTNLKCPDCAAFTVMKSLLLNIWICWQCNWIDTEPPKDEADEA